MKKFLTLAVATWFGSGLVPPPHFLRGMAGTYGSIAALPFCWLWILLMRLGIDSANDFWAGAILVIILYLSLIAIITIIGTSIVPAAEKFLGSRTDWRGRTKYRDQNQIVFDEVLGMLVTCSPLTFLPVKNWWLVYALALIWFRIFDIVKVWPTKNIDRQHTGFSVMADDIMAGIYAAAALWFSLIIIQ